MRLFGLFAVTASDGRDLTPTGKKARGVLALIAAGEDLCRSRRWLERKLWSNRGAEQARGSLRQALLDIRKTLDPDKTLLLSDRNSVWLNKDLVHTDLAEAPQDREFLEGLEVGDQAFDLWVAEMRAQFRSQHPVALPRAEGGTPRIQIGPVGGVGAISGGAHQGALARTIDDQIGKFLTEFIAGAQRVSALSEGVRPDLVVQSAVEDTAEGHTVFVQVIDPASDRLIHSDFTNFISAETFINAPDQMAQFCWNMADWTLEELPRVMAPDSELAFRTEQVQHAFRETLSFDGARMQAALDGARIGGEALKDGLFLSVQAWIMMSMILEEFLPEDTATLDEIRGLMRRAEALSPHCPLVKAIHANLDAMLFEQFDAAYAAARRSLKSNRNNIFALQSLAACSVRLDNLEQAYTTSRRCAQMARNSKFEAMSAIYHVLICLQSDREAEAFEAARYAVEIAPEYRAAQRTMLGLLGKRGAVDEAQKRLKALGSLESGFSLDRFFDDPDYPVFTLRRTGILKAARAHLM